MADRVPVAQFLYFSPSNPATGHPYALLDWVEGERLEIVAADVGTTDLSELGQAVGEALAGIGSFTFPEPGFLDGELGIAQPFRLDSRGYLAFLDGSLADEHLRDRLAVDLTNQLLEFAHREAPRLDGIDPTPRLVHSDFGGSNILVERRSGRWSVSAVLDWKFAFSGTPILDIGNLLRPPLGRLTAFETAFIQTFAEHGGALPGDWRRQSRFADLLAWVAFLKRPAARPRLIADARGMIEARCKTGNPGASDRNHAAITRAGLGYALKQSVRGRYDQHGTSKAEPTDRRPWAVAPMVQERHHQTSDSLFRSRA